MEGRTRRDIARTILLAALLPVAARAAPLPVRIGAVLSLTGPYASLGIPQRKTFALFPQTIAGRALEVRIEDDVSDAGIVERACQRMMERDGVDIPFGTTVTPTTLSAVPIAGTTGTPAISFAAPSADIKPQEGDRRWLFKPALADRLTTEALAAHMTADGSGPSSQTVAQIENGKSRLLGT